MAARIRISFANVPLGESFYDPWGEWCVKVSETTARDSWCAPGFCLEFQPDYGVEIDPRKLPPGHPALAKD
jgi:hypothetical protein